MAAPRPHRVVLLSLDWLRPKDPRRSLGHAALLAKLATVPDLDVVSICRAVNVPAFRREEVLGAVREALAPGPADLAIGVYVWNEEVVRWLLSELRRAGFTGRIILGGPQISYATPGVGRLYPEADAVVRGYGEDALVQVLAAKDPTPLAGVAWRGQPDLGSPAPVELERLPSPILSGVVPVQPFMRWETQRGCIYACSFCQHRQAGARLERRTLAPGRITDEISALVGSGARDIAVLDPIFNASAEAVAILQRFAAAGYTGRLSLQSRFELLDEPFLDACEALDVCLEFGLQTVHPAEMRAVHRMNNLDRVEQAIADLHRRGRFFEVSLIYGLPGQTLASFEATVRWCQERGVPVIRAFPLMLLRGTALERERARWGLVENDGETDGAIPVVVESSTFTRADWEQMRRLADSLLPLANLRGAA